MNTAFRNQIGSPLSAGTSDKLDMTLGERCAIIVPCLNEAAHIRNLVSQLKREAEELNLKIIIADGGSTDGTREVLGELARANPRIAVIENEKKLQAAAVNKAVRLLPDSVNMIIRIDAHGEYPPDYCSTLMKEAAITGADSVVVGMVAQGASAFQKATAIAQNSKLGNGGSMHRSGSHSRWVEHGHHALMRVAPFREVSGYDETFSHNEDAELDRRLTNAGYRIWMTSRTHMIYFPRSRILSLFKQYLGYGRGRAKNIIKHRTRPKLRQALPLLVLPVVACTALATLHWWVVLPAAIWVSICLGYGIVTAIKGRMLHGSLAGLSMITMHLGWSTGFWVQVIQSIRHGAARA
jgi:succinoglycan biosynthesis protein ExoA